MKSSYTNSLAHTTWECKYRIVFAPKFRRKKDISQTIGLVFRDYLESKKKQVFIQNVCKI